MMMRGMRVGGQLASRAFLNEICIYSQLRSTTYLTQATKYNNLHINQFHTTTPLRMDMFSNLGGRLKKLWKGEGAQPEEKAAAPTATEQEMPELTQEEKEAAEREDKKLMDNITQGKFNLNDYHREISRLVKMAKAKGAFDSVKGTVKKMLGKKEQAQHDEMKQMIVDFESQIVLMNAMTEQEKINPDAFYDHAFKTKQRIVASVGQTVADFNLLMQKYEQSRMVYMILHEVKKKGKDIPTDTEKILPFVQEHAHLLSDKDRIRVRKTMKNMKR